MLRSALLRSVARQGAFSPRLRPVSYHTTPGSRKAAEAEAHQSEIPHQEPPSFRERRDARSQRVLQTQWVATGNEAFTTENLLSLFNNKLSSLVVNDVLSAEECDRMVKVIETHDINYYGEKVFPPIGCVGVTQFENATSMQKYFASVEKAKSLQNRFMKEAGVDVVGRVQSLIQSVAPLGLPVRLAQEDGKPYFAGLLRLINSSALIHADYGPFDGPEWEIGAITAQLTWNILLKEVQGGESVVYNRPWRGKEDDDKYRDVSKSYGYSRDVVKSYESKTLTPMVGQLGLFNPRNFHEVKPIASPEKCSRYTFSSFIGYLPPTNPAGPAIILWS